jgi:hypothetical protein
MEEQMQRIVLAFWSLLHEDEGTDSAKLTGILGPLHKDGGAGATKFIEVLGPVA